MAEKKPEECDGCNISEVDLDKFENLGVLWLCAYCANSFDVNKTTEMAAMFNTLEKRLKAVIK